MFLLLRWGNYIHTRNRKQFRELSSFILLAVAWLGHTNPSCSLNRRVMEARHLCSQTSPPRCLLSLPNCAMLGDCHTCESSVGSKSAFTVDAGQGLKFWCCCPRKATFKEGNCTAADGCAAKRAVKQRQRLPWKWVFIGSYGLAKSSHTFKPECLILKEK